ncbi:cation:proton antiporter [Alkalimonas sp. NCh-2]|uniref:cation:proton antiporter domain-containing protein n=1 Tax=Alkalimonas sp. NCh-2 TaxID=3144846 RepID=UPI0031F69280
MVIAPMLLDGTLIQLLFLLGFMVFMVMLFQRAHIPASIAYLLVGVLLGAHTAGPVISEGYIHKIAEFGIVFLLFTIGLRFSWQQIYQLRHTILGLGTAQVGLTTLLVALLLWAIGVTPVVAFVIGAVFAQSSTTIISKQLLEQGEDQSRHGRLGISLSVFQDITAVPFIIVIPVLGVAMAQDIASTLGMALFKAVLATALVVLVGRYLLRHLFHRVSSSDSAELFTLTVLLVCLAAAWLTQSLGLSMAFGAFLAGMVMGETEFKLQVEAAIRPFRDVLLGIFFVSIGMLLDPMLLPEIGHIALAGALLLLLIKIVLVTALVLATGVALETAFRTGLILAVGGEFGFALLALALEGGTLDNRSSQIILTSVLLSMMLAVFLIRYNLQLSRFLVGRWIGQAAVSSEPFDDIEQHGLQQHVVIAGFGRIGQGVAQFLQKEQVPYIGLDLDAARVKNARLADVPVFYADSTDADTLMAAGLAKARLLVISHEDLSAALITLRHARKLCPDLPVIVRTRDESHVAELRQAGATEVIPETLEAGMMLTSHVLLMLNVPARRVNQLVQEQRLNRYQLLRQQFRGSADLLKTQQQEQLKAVLLAEGSPAIGQSLQTLDLAQFGIQLTELVRAHNRITQPSLDMVLQENDVLVLFGSVEALEQASLLLTHRLAAD